LAMTSCIRCVLNDGSLLSVVGASAGSGFQRLQQLQPLRLVCRHAARTRPFLHNGTFTWNQQQQKMVVCAVHPELAVVLCGFRLIFRPSATVTALQPGVWQREPLGAGKARLETG
jgi:hypothetical protein